MLYHKIYFCFGKTYVTKFSKYKIFLLLDNNFWKFQSIKWVSLELYLYHGHHVLHFLTQMIFYVLQPPKKDIQANKNTSSFQNEIYSGIVLCCIDEQHLEGTRGIASKISTICVKLY